MNKILKYLRQNTFKVILVICFCIFVICLTRAADDQYKVDTSNTQNKNIIVADNKKIFSKKEIEKIITDFLNEVTSGNYETAYEYLSPECKSALFPNFQSFTDDYCKNLGVSGKDYSFEKMKKYSTDTYKITFNDYISSGKKNSQAVIDYYTVIEDDDTLKLNINSFMKSKIINKKDDNKDLQISIKKLNIFCSYVEAEITFENNTDNSIVIKNAIINKDYSAINKETEIQDNKEEELKYKFYIEPETNIEKITFKCIIENEEKDIQVKI